MRGLAILWLGCLGWTGSAVAEDAQSAYRAEWTTWHRARLDRLTAEDGFLSLAGLYWLAEGENRFGAAGDNDIVFPDPAPAHIGVFALAQGQVSLSVNAGVAVFREDPEEGKTPVRALDFPDLTDADPAPLALDSLLFYPIERSGCYGIRLKDLHSETRLNFGGIEHFPPDASWRIEGRFEPFAEPRTVPVPSIIGTVSDTPWPGDALFTIGGTEYRLAVFGEEASDDFFTVFADQTNGDDTYGGGRFLVIERLADNRVVVDFNKAYNPPCAFTDYATCPLPPAQNHLAVRIEAGEQYRGDH